ncbi:6-phosphofructokinase [Dehalobacterium formicoaceticum]|uniref:Pyrophosphate--fructose 6-phosphate 1-phosphotransferase n=1 Tax=Dehalobacterium formicoaceticum TaxID=51515 RepID=A0ABT1Y9Q4_9FIRM|nr:6-phosphofructokinase [Dehalobacterium formicoaceticum]MCR6546835.1 6-phosphofructokinase [Dehalobacterium formicoaceticum]
MGLIGKVVVAQGGGPTIVINQSLVGVVLESRKSTQITSVYGAIKGVEGILNEDFIDLTMETSHNLEQVGLTPSSALLSTRDKPDERYCQELFRVLKAHDIRYFFYIGGNDSADTVRIVNDNANKAHYNLRTIHIPKTIDNDVVLNDHTPGYGSAARFVAQAFSGANLDNRSLPGVYIIVVMGRNAGFLTAASSLAQKFSDDGPHLIYLPERTFRIDDFLKEVKEVYDRYGRCLVAVSEGIRDEQHRLIITKLVDKIGRDAHGNLELTSNNFLLGDYLASIVKKNLNIKRVRSDTLGYFQRSFNGCVSDVDQHEAREVGEKAAQFAIRQNLDGSVVIERSGYYSVEYHLKPLADVAGKTRVMPDHFINPAGNNVTDTFKFYLRPLIGSGFPSAYRLQAPRVPKILESE